MEEGNGRFKSSQGKNSGNVLGVFISADTYGKKGRNLWSELSKGVGNHDNQTLRRNVRGTTNLHNVCCALIRHLFFYAFD